ncbi:MAG TPA: hypothetical protein VHF69_06225, partial [Candidatus Synoicihabitans sp.]|nr:hypothetical protein [Candidatus Synoicihabitans sp.]
AVYTAGTTLCETIYERTADGDGPVDIGVVVRGVQFSLGENILTSKDRCTREGNARSPAVTDGRLTAFARPGLSGPDVIGLPWAIVVASGHEANVVLDGIQYPGGIEWLTDSRLLFTGSMLGRDGVWAIDAEGTRLVYLGDVLLGPFSLSPDHFQLSGLRPRPPSDPPRPAPIDVDVYRYDLSSIVNP